jgi:hypothetical protein
MQKARQVTYNYSLSKELASRLSDYCDQTGRTSSDVLRQLVLEYLEGDRSPVVARAPSGPSVRSSLILRATTLAAFDKAAHPHGKAPVLEALLRAFLDRSPKAGESVAVTVLLPVSVVRALSEQADRRATTLSDLIAQIAQTSLPQREFTKKES